MFTALLIVAVIVLTVVIVRGQKPAEAPQAQVLVVREPALTTAATTALPAPTTQPKPEGFKTYEQLTEQALREANSEGFAICPTGTSEPTVQCTKGNQFAKSEYGSADDFKDYVAKNGGLDDRVIQNHKQWVKERKSLGPSGEFTTGRTYSPDSHDSYDPVPWVGIRGRPRGVTQCNPTQVPDIDTTLYRDDKPVRLL